jgi:hypothetical protein
MKSPISPNISITLADNQNNQSPRKPVISSYKIQTTNTNVTRSPFSPTSSSSHKKRLIDQDPELNKKCNIKLAIGLSIGLLLVIVGVAITIFTGISNSINDLFHEFYKKETNNFKKRCMFIH